MNVIDPLIKGVIVPLVISLAFVLLAMPIWKFSRRPWVDAVFFGLPVALGGLSAYLGLNGPLSLPPNDALQWIILFALIAPLLVILNSFFQKKIVSIVICVAFFGGLFWFALQPFVEYTWNFNEGIIHGMGIVGGFCFLSVAAHFFGRPLGEPSDIVCSLLVLGGTAAALVLSGSALMGQMMGAYAAALGPMLIVTNFGARPQNSTGISLVLIVACLGLAIVGHYFSELSLISLIGICLGVFLSLCGARSMVFFGFGKPLIRTLVCGGIMLAIVGFELFQSGYI